MSLFEFFWKGDGREARTHLPRRDLKKKIDVKIDVKIENQEFFHEEKVSWEFLGRIHEEE